MDFANRFPGTVKKTIEELLLHHAELHGKREVT
jgi:hypothetical protein